MPKIDLSLTITTIIAIAAVISPILTNLITIRYQKWLKKEEMKQHTYEQTIMYKRNVFENYIKTLNAFFQYQNAEVAREYAPYYSLAYIYATELDSRKLLLSINEKVHNRILKNEDVDAAILLIDIELQKLSPKYK